MNLPLLQFKIFALRKHELGYIFLSTSQRYWHYISKIIIIPYVQPGRAGKALSYTTFTFGSSSFPILHIKGGGGSPGMSHRSPHDTNTINRCSTRVQVSWLQANVLPSNILWLHSLKKLNTCGIKKTHLGPPSYPPLPCIISHLQLTSAAIVRICRKGLGSLGGLSASQRFSGLFLRMRLL